MLVEQDLIDFEHDIAECYRNKMIKAPIHLRGGCEKNLIEIFKDVRPEDYIFCYWASHLHCLLKGVPREELKAAILAGKSISLCFPEYRIFSSGIVGSLAGVAVGTAFALKRQNKNGRVWLFTGDMGAKCGIFKEAFTYSYKHDLKITFIEEDNGISVMTPTSKVWNNDSDIYTNVCYDYFSYENTWPHSGINERVSF